MDVKKLIETGILELYIAGELPEDEMIAITKNVNAYSEIKAEVERLEKAFMVYAALNTPPISKKVEQKILEIGKIPPKGNSKFKNIFCIIGLFLLLISLYFNYYQYRKGQETGKQVKLMEAEKAGFTQNLQELEETYELSKIQFDEIRHPQTQKVVLASTGKVAEVEAVVFWNRQTQNVYVDASALPEPPEGKVYQLWWLTSLEPLSPNDGGLLNDFIKNHQKLFTGKPTNSAVAFAITLEPEGGSETPTLSELYVLGKI